MIIRIKLMNLIINGMKLWKNYKVIHLKLWMLKEKINNKDNNN